MKISEIVIKPAEPNNERLLGFASVVIDGDFVVHDIKIINGNHGPFVAMPSRKLCDKCPACRSKNHLRANFCGHCGGQLASDRASRDETGRPKLHADVAHPIDQACREYVQREVLNAYDRFLAEAEMHAGSEVA